MVVLQVILFSLLVLGLVGILVKKYARTLGYQCGFIQGYLFKSNSTLFTGYVQDLYYLKSNATDPIMRQIAKLLLNSLYGRWGMNIDNKNIIITKDKHEIDDIKAKHVIINEDIIKVDNLIYYHLIYSNDLNPKWAAANPKEAYKYLKSIEIDESNIICNYAIAASITAYSRLMKNEVAPKNAHLIDDDKYYVRDPIFIAPKIYGYKTLDDKEIIKCKGSIHTIINNQSELKKSYWDAITDPGYDSDQDCNIENKTIMLKIVNFTGDPSKYNFIKTQEVASIEEETKAENNESFTENWTYIDLYNDISSLNNYINSAPNIYYYKTAQA
ncbi:hypothetical protein HDU92_001380 [Lobulomyces angularis]|nr:hypothetical protein HDU92_001380 [Lobulomyces angularis]